MNPTTNTIDSPPDRSTNWAMIIRVGIVATLVLGLVGYAMKVTYESVIKGGVVNRGDFYDVELQAMGNFSMDEKLGTVDDVPRQFRELDGKKVQLNGEVAPVGTDGGSQVSRFTICYSVAKCCVGGSPKPQHFVYCSTAGGKLVPNYLYSSRVRVFGTLHVKVTKEAGIVSSVYHLDLERVEPIS